MRRSRRKRCLLSIEPLEKRELLTTGITQLTNFTGTVPTAEISNPVAVGNVVFFAANDRIHGYELWKSDGTVAGTVMVADIHPAFGGRNLGSYPAGITNVNGVAYFRASRDNGSGFELWKSDGTAAGTQRVADIAPGAASSYPKNLFNANGTLYFTATDSTHGRELWKSDGTTKGTVLVKDINFGSNDAAVYQLTLVGSTIFFSASDATHNSALWKTDGTQAGTVFVKDFSAIRPTNSPSSLVNLKGQLYFVATTPEAGRELWTSDGTTAGTKVLKDFTAGPGDSNPSNLYIWNDSLYFSVSSANTGYELWKTNGSAQTTVLVTDLVPGSGSSFATPLVAVNGWLYFLANDSQQFRELWKYNPADGAKLVQHGVPVIDPQTAVAYQNSLYVVEGGAIWRSDGTELGTHDVPQFHKSIEHFTVAGEKIFFQGFPDGEKERQFFVYEDRPETTIAPALVDLGGGKTAQRITVSDIGGQDDHLRVSRVGKYVQITDFSVNPTSKLTVTGIAGATGNGTQVVRIPIATITATGQPLAFNLGAGLDYLSVDSGATTESSPIPQTSMIVDLGADEDTLDLVNSTSNVWNIVDVQAGNVQLGNLGGFRFRGAENLIGGSGYDEFRNLTKLWYTGIKSVNGDSAGTGDKIDWLNDSHNMSLQNYGFVTYLESMILVNIEAASIHGGDNDNQLYARFYTWPLTFDGAGGNDTQL